MSQHLKILGILTIVYHGLLALLVLVIIPVFMGASLFADSPEAATILGGLGVVITTIILALTLPGIIGGIGLLKGKSWGRIVVLIANALYILSFPLGTALTVYSFWVLTKEESRVILEA
ncbi:MAG: hypothetical protein AB7H80_03825 [Candidatus Kapaibacterium sp.]